MNKLRRYYTAIHRYSRSKGFGIHSPFAFNFVLRVLREQCQYYAYADIEKRRRMVLSLVAKSSRHPRVISIKNAKMLFRIVCRFHPSTILQCGVSYGVSSTVMLDVDSSSRLIIYTGENKYKSIYDTITEPYANRITQCPTLDDAISTYQESSGNKAPFVLVDDVTETDFTLLSTTLSEAINNDGVIIIRNISRSKLIRQLWNDITSAMPHGMSFSNDRIGIIVGYHRLPRQHFLLWF